MKKRYKAVPYHLYGSSDEELIHFNEETLDLTEITPLHKTLLEEFCEACLKSDVLEKYQEVIDIEEVIDDLIELGLISHVQSLHQIAVVDLRPNIRAFRIVLTEKCNLRCVECFVTKEQARLRTMTPATLDRVIRQSIPYGVSHRITYHFFGGEPLLRFDYIKRAVEIIDEAVAQGEMIRPLYTMTTNLTLLDQEILFFLAEHDVKVGVSIDGPEGINDNLRIYADGRGTFQDVARNYSQLIEYNIDAHVLITPHPDYLDELPAIFRHILEVFPMQTITVNTPLHFHTLQWTVPGERYAKLLIELMFIAKDFGVSVDSAASPPLAALAGNIRREGPCALVKDSIMASVGPDGSLSFCAQKWHPFLSVPEVSSGTTLHTPIRRDDECKTCEARYICGGPCPAYQKIRGAHLDGNKCDFMRALLKEVVGNISLFELSN
jgi:radical SAM protein with 4Fe4S-binding SPASM domain